MLSALSRSSVRRISSIRSYSSSNSGWDGSRLDWPVGSARVSTLSTKPPRDVGRSALSLTRSAGENGVTSAGRQALAEAGCAELIPTGKHLSSDVLQDRLGPLVRLRRARPVRDDVGETE